VEVSWRGRHASTAAGCPRNGRRGAVGGGSGRPRGRWRPRFGLAADIGVPAAVGGNDGDDDGVGCGRVGRTGHGDHVAAA